LISIGGDELPLALKAAVRQGMLLVTVGLVLGLLGAVAMTRAMSNLLYAVGATDPLTFVGTSLLLATLALLSTLIPARRAAGVDPLVALRYE
jgi:putative ABC transport system permease protein